MNIIDPFLNIDFIFLKSNEFLFNIKTLTIKSQYQNKQK